MYRHRQFRQVAHLLCVYICLVNFSFPLLEHHEGQKAVLELLNHDATKKIHPFGKVRTHLSKEVQEIWDQNMISGACVARVDRPYQLDFKLPLKLKFSVPFNMPF